MFCENLISRVKPFFIYKNGIYLIENQRFFLQHQHFFRMIAIPTLSISRIIALWCIFWSMTKNQGICQQCHPWFSPPLFSKSLLTEGWCFAGILGRASLTEGPIYCRQTLTLWGSSFASLVVQCILALASDLDLCAPSLSTLRFVENSQTSESFIVSCTWYVRSWFKKILTEKLSSGTSGFQKTLSISPQNRAYLCRWSFQFYP